MFMNIMMMMMMETMMVVHVFDYQESQKLKSTKVEKTSNYNAILDQEGSFQVANIEGDHTRKSCINFSLIIHFQAQQHVFFTGLKQTNNSEQRS